jgi:ankyrin repeat protein
MTKQKLPPIPKNLLDQAHQLIQEIHDEADHDPNYDYLESSKGRELLKALNEIIDKKYDINTRNDEGLSLLHDSVNSGLIDLVPLLISKGSDINVKNLQGQTSLISATLSKHYEMIDCLLKNNANVNISNKEGINFTSTACFFFKTIGPKCITQIAKDYAVHKNLSSWLLNDQITFIVDFNKIIKKHPEINHITHSFKQSSNEAISIFYKELLPKEYNSRKNDFAEKWLHKLGICKLEDGVIDKNNSKTSSFALCPKDIIKQIGLHIFDNFEPAKMDKYIDIISEELQEYNLLIGKDNEQIT